MNVTVLGEPLSAFGYNRLFSDFCTQKGEIGKFLPFSGDEAVFSTASARPPFPVDENYLRSFNPVPLTEPQEHSLHALVTGQAHAVVTGQQVVAFGGPLLVLWKALSAVYHAGRLEKLLQKPVVPVFWLADEDHDLAEILTQGFPAKNGFEHIRFEAQPHTPGIPAGNCLIETVSWKEASAKLLSQSKDQETYVWLESILAAEAGTTFLEMFRRIIQQLLGSYGLLFAGSNTEIAKRQTRNLIKTALSKSGQIKSTLDSRSEALKREYHQQAVPAEINLFYFDSTSTRLKIERIESGFAAGSITGSESWWMEEADRNPERFSPNVFLRPLFQDTLLPTVGFIGGPAEVAYFAQLRPLYAVFGMKAPVVFPRFTGTVLDSAEADFLAENRISVESLRNRIEKLEKDWLESNSAVSSAARLLEVKNQLGGILSGLEPGLRELDVTLVESLSARKSRINRELERLEEKMRRAEKRKNIAMLHRLRQIKMNAAFGEVIQERNAALLWALARFGSGFIDSLYRSLLLNADAGTHHVCTVEL